MEDDEGVMSNVLKVENNFIACGTVNLIIVSSLVSSNAG